MKSERHTEIASSIVHRVISFPFLPVLVALVIPLRIVQANPDLFTGMASLTRVTIFATATALALTFALWALFRDLDRAGLLAAFLVGVLVAGAGHAKLGAQIMESTFGLPVPSSLVLLGIFLVPAVVVAMLRVPRVVTHAGNAATAVLLAYNAVALWLSGPGSIEPYQPQTRMFLDLRASERKPDIVHILLDGYSRQDVLAEVYGYDNSNFLSGLEELGFEIAGDAVSPYNQTLLTMQSVFSGNYPPLASPSDNLSAPHYRSRLVAAFRSNQVMSALQDIGYKVIAPRSEYPPLSLEGTPMAAEHQGFSMTFLEQTFFEFSGLSLIAQDSGLLEMFTENSASVVRKALRTVTDEKDEVPRFHFVHLLAPHPPFDFSSDGTTIATVGILNKLADGSHFHANLPEMKETYRQGYLAKLQFTNSQILPFLKETIANRRGPLIIILHGDHGGGMHFDQDNPANTCLRERFLPLVAVYSSDGKLQDAVPEEVNLVNLYRILFNTYFGTDYELLPSKITFVPFLEPTPHTFIEPERLELGCDG